MDGQKGQGEPVVKARISQFYCFSLYIPPSSSRRPLLWCSLIPVRNIPQKVLFTQATYTPENTLYPIPMLIHPYYPILEILRPIYHGPGMYTHNVRVRYNVYCPFWGYPCIQKFPRRQCHSDRVLATVSKNPKFSTCAGIIMSTYIISVCIIGPEVLHESRLA